MLKKVGMNLASLFVMGLGYAILVVAVVSIISMVFVLNLASANEVFSWGAQINVLSLPDQLMNLLMCAMGLSVGKWLTIKGQKMAG